MNNWHCNNCTKHWAILFFFRESSDCEAKCNFSPFSVIFSRLFGVSYRWVWMREKQTHVKSMRVIYRNNVGSFICVISLKIFSSNSSPFVAINSMRPSIVVGIGFAVAVAFTFVFAFDDVAVIGVAGVDGDDIDAVALWHTPAFNWFEFMGGFDVWPALAISMQLLPLAAIFWSWFSFR